MKKRESVDKGLATMMSSTIKRNDHGAISQDTTYSSGKQFVDDLLIAERIIIKWHCTHTCIFDQIHAFVAIQIRSHYLYHGNLL